MKIEVIDKTGAYHLKGETLGSAGIDLRNMDHDKTLFPGTTHKIDTGLSIWIKDPNYAGFILARSSIATKNNLAPANKVGLIDSDYQGPLIVALHNHGSNAQRIKYGQRIAQLIIMPIATFDMVLVDEFSNVTERGEGGFGSTGIN